MKQLSKVAAAARHAWFAPAREGSAKLKARTFDGCARALLPQMALSRFSRHVMGLRYYNAGG